MLTYLRTSIFDSPAQTLVNTVNVVGVMGKGVAKGFKSRFPEMFQEYRRLCEAEDLRIGTLHLWRGPDKWVMNFPTKTTWRKPSRLEYVERGLSKFVEVYESLGITSISLPPLGCGNGNLDWIDVKPLMERYLRQLPIRVYVHDRHVTPDFVPEHLEGRAHLRRPYSFDGFLHDVKSTLHANRGTFQTLTKGTTFNISFSEDYGLIISRNDKNERLPHEELENAWAALQGGILSLDQFSGVTARRNKTYLFAVLATLPYVRVAEIQPVRAESSTASIGLFLTPKISDCDQKAKAHATQGELWQSPKSVQNSTWKNTR